MTWQRRRATRRRAEAVLARHGPSLRRRRGVVAVAVGPRRRRGRWRDDEICVQVFVRRKISPPEAIPPRMRLPSEVDGVPVDVIEAEFTGFLCPHGTVDRRKRHPALLGGIALSNPSQPDFGTLGAVLRDSGHVYLLTAAHVAGPVGDAVAQPFLPADAVGTVVVARWSTASNLDAALTDIDPAAHRSVSPGMYGGPVSSVATGDIRTHVGDVVVHGACNGAVRAKVVSLAWNGPITYAGGVTVVYHDHALIEPRAGALGPGDSGAVVLSASSATLLGLLIGGDRNGSKGVVTPLPTILDLAAFQPGGERLWGV